MSHIGCIVMASGASTRFGSNKLMASFMGKPLIQHVIETAQTAGLEPIVVTIDDPFHEPILALCNKLKVRAVTHSGTLQSDTVHRAMLEVQKDGLGGSSWDGAMFLQGDQPCVRADSLCALIASFEEHPEVVSRLSWHGVPGSPIVFPSTLFDMLCRVQGDKGGSGVFLLCPEYQASAVLVEAQCEQELLDVDTPSDLNYLHSASINGLTTERLGVD